MRNRDARVVGGAGANAVQRPSLTIPIPGVRCIAAAGAAAHPIAAFSTRNQCMATVRGIGGFCQRNQFYNPRPASARSCKRQMTY
jgi:hypothetical protein